MIYDEYFPPLININTPVDIIYGARVAGDMVSDSQNEVYEPIEHEDPQITGDKTIERVIREAISLSTEPDRNVADGDWEEVTGDNLKNFPFGEDNVGISPM